MPKTFAKMSLKDQEAYLVKKLSELYSEEDAVKKMLGKVRGGQRIIIAEPEDRPDLIELKSA